MQAAFLLMVAAVANALPAARDTTSCGQFLDTCDTLPATNNITPELGPQPGLYHGLTYTNWHTNQIPKGSGLTLPSLFNGVTSFGTNNVLGKGSLNLQAFGSISTGPGVKTFDLSLFYFACLLPAGQSNVNLATSCRIAVYGYLPNGTEVAAEEFRYTPAKDKTGQSAMQQVILGSKFADVQNMTIAILVESATAVADVLVVDSLQHTNAC